MMQFDAEKIKSRHDFLTAELKKHGLSPHPDVGNWADDQHKGDASYWAMRCGMAEGSLITALENSIPIDRLLAHLTQCMTCMDHYEVSGPSGWREIAAEWFEHVRTEEPQL